MASQWTFGKKIGAGFALVTVLTALTSGLGMYALESTVEEKDEIINVEQPAAAAALKAVAAFERKIVAVVGYLLTREARHLDAIKEARENFRDALSEMEPLVRTDAGRRFIEDMRRLEGEGQKVVDRVIELRQSEGQQKLAASVAEFDDKGAPIRAQIREAQNRFLEFKQKRVADAVKESNDAARNASALLAVAGGLAVLLAVIAALLLTRQLSTQLGSAVQHMQAASAELNSAAAEQASGTTEQTAAVTETSTTLKELVATARQMTEGAQRVTRIAEQSASTARGGDATVQKAQEAINTIKRQVDLIVQHMLDLGKKSQQVGVVLELINELAEQTNILAINATIESAGAGEAGKRFAVVADEIRKLADRVGASTKEIRTLIEDIRSSANTTVMATEDGSKAVDAGTKQFAEVATTFRQIADGVVTTTEASREIELGTRQQVTAVEQVNSALAGIQTAAQQSEKAARQTQETSGTLVALAKNLQSLVQAGG